MKVLMVLRHSVKLDKAYIVMNKGPYEVIQKGKK